MITLMNKYNAQSMIWCEVDYISLAGKNHLKFKWVEGLGFL